MAIEESQLKFTKSKETGEIIGFVSRTPKTRKLNGVFEDSPFGKKICVLSEELKGTIKTGIPYKVQLKPMHNGNGYVVIAAEPATFEAEVRINVVPRAIYQVCVTFGNKTIYFDPKDGKTKSSRTYGGALKVITSRTDIKDPEKVIEEFKAAAHELIRLMEQDGYYLNFSQ